MAFYRKWRRKRHRDFIHDRRLDHLGGICKIGLPLMVGLGTPHGEKRDAVGEVNSDVKKL